MSDKRLAAAFALWLAGGIAFGAIRREDFRHPGQNVVASTPGATPRKPANALPVPVHPWCGCRG